LALGYFGADSPLVLAYLATETPVPTDTPLPTPTPTATDTPRPTASPTATFTALPTFTPQPDSDYTDEQFLDVLGSYHETDAYDFSGDREPGWYNFSEDFGSMSMQGGYLQMTLMPEQGFGLVGRIPVGIVHDFVLEADFSVVQFGADGKRQFFGFLFRNTDPLYYAATVTPDGTYSVWSGSEETERLIADLESIP
jgi:hypothetical protein